MSQAAEQSIPNAAPPRAANEEMPPAGRGGDPIHRLRGVRAIVEDAVTHGTTAVEQIHLATADVPFSLLSKVPVLDAPVKEIRVLHDETVKSSYRIVRLVTHAVARSIDALLDVVESRGEPETASVEPKKDATAAPEAASEVPAPSAFDDTVEPVRSTA